MMGTRLLGVILVVVGILALAVGGFRYTQRENVVDAGPLKVSADRTHHVPISPIVGGLALAGGAVLLLAGNDRRRRIV